MKLPMLVAVAAAAVAAVSAAECTADQLVAVGEPDGAALVKACPSLYPSGRTAITPTHIDTLTPGVLASCMDKGCITALKNVVAVVPNCSVKGINIKALTGASATVCEGFGNGTMTLQEGRAILQDLVTNMTKALEDGSTDGSAVVGGSNGAGKTPVPTKTTSAAIAVSVAGVLVFTTVGAIALL